MSETPEQIAKRVRATLPGFLKNRTPQQVRADEDAQALRRASFTRAKLTEAEHAVSRGAQLEEIARANLQTMGERTEEETSQELIRLAIGLELQGRVDEAADIHPVAEEQSRLQELTTAIERDDSELCDCPSQKATMNGEELTIQPYYEVRRIYSRKHGQMVSLVGCGDPECTFLNATPTPPAQLSRILGNQKGTGKRVGSDAQLLKL